MRRIGTLGDPEAARRLAGAFRDRGIKAEFRSDVAGGVAVWIVDEDQLTLARDELAAFEADPTAERFRPVAETPVAEPAAATEPVRPPRSSRPAWRRVPVTLALIVASGLVFAATWGGTRRTETSRALSIASFRVEGNHVVWPELSEIESGQVWRAVTPIFLHFGPLHLLFNMMWVWMLGGAIESLRGSTRLALIVLVAAVASNLAEYHFNFGFNFDGENGFQADFNRTPDPMFGGMSGVVFALFGFIWMRSRLIPRSGFAMPRDTVVWMLMWLLVCTSGLVGPIANVAHGVGLLVGMMLGAVPRLWRRA